LLRQRDIEAVGMSGSLYVASGSAFAEHLQNRIARDQVNQKEDNRDHEPDHRERVEQAKRKISKHRSCSIPQRAEAGKNWAIDRSAYPVRVTTFFRPIRGFHISQFYPRLAPWALILRRFAAQVSASCFTASWSFQFSHTVTTVCATQNHQFSAGFPDRRGL
jgi:hypothetical protein